MAPATATTATAPACCYRHYYYYSNCVYSTHQLAPPLSAPCDLTDVTSWDGYRLGDVVYGGGFFRDNLPRLRAIYVSSWPSSLATEYLNRTEVLDQGSQDDRVRALAAIVGRRGRRAPDLPGRDTLVVHLRLGDVTETPMGPNGRRVVPPSAHDLWEVGGVVEKSGRQYIKPRAYFERALERTPPAVTRVTFVGSLHHNEGAKGMTKGAPRSAMYRDLVEAFFVARGYEVAHRWEGLPDDDFVYMAHARYFAQSGGGYSRLVARCVDRLNGTVVVRDVYNASRVGSEAVTIPKKGH